MLLPPPEITSSPRPGTGNTILSGLPTNPPAGGSGMLPAVLVLNPNQMPGPPPPPPPKPKPTQYDFRYEDSDTLMQEINEFFSYAETEHLGSKRAAFEASFEGLNWVSASAADKEAYLQTTLGELTSSEQPKRIAAASALCYVLSGSWKESMGPEHQLHLLSTNSNLLRSLGGLAPILDNLSNVAQVHSALHSRIDDGFDEHAHAPLEEIETLDTELGLALEMAFLVIEVGRGDELLAAELLGRDPPTLIFLMQIIASLKDTLKERALRTFPLKKLLLVTWKVLLASLGGLRDAQKVATLNRELEDLPEIKSDWQGFAKSSAGDIARFRSEMSVKYPTFDPAPPTNGVAITHHLPRPEKLAEALAPIPIRPHYHAPLRDPTEDVFTSLFHSAQPPSHSAQPMPLTPAPSPQPSPQIKPKKEKWQTDPLRPFIFPFSSAMGGRTIPAAIKEADDLFSRHMYIPLGVWQLWREREEFIREDMGVPALSLDDENATATKSEHERAKRVESIRAEAERARAEGDFKASRKASERESNLKKLDYVETVYKGVLSSTLPSTVVVLLKQILATLPAQPPAGANGQGFGGTAIASPGERLDGLDSIEFPEEEKKPEPTVAEIDAMREKEIISKAGSAIILLLMKWFKSAHVLKFQHLSQLLLDMNCPLIMVKTFLLQDSVELVKSRNEVDDKNFFRFCMLNHSSHPPPKEAEESLTVPPPRVVPRRAVSPSGHPGAPDDEEIELLSDYSWRNFFSAINRIKIIQKLLKGRTHQIHQFNQYKTFNTFKRMLKVQHPMFQLQVLKIIKAQIPHYGKKWKQQNMKIVTAIYLNCRPDLRDEWLVSVMEKDELEESNLQEQALRSLVRFYHSKHYAHLINPPPGLHGRTGSSTGPYFHSNGSNASQHHEYSHHAPHHRRTLSSSGDNDIFPPNRTRRISSTSSHSPSRLPDDFAESWRSEYEDVLEDVFGEPEEGEVHGALSGWGPLSGALANLGVEGDAWLFGGDDSFSDVSSIASIGELGGRARLNDGEDEDEDDEDDEDDNEIARPPRSPVDEVEACDVDDDEKGDEEDPNRNNWEHLSALTKSPIQLARRRSSGGSPLRPVMKGNGIDGPELTDDIEELEELGPIPKEESDGPAVDEVEAMYGE